ncbi:GspH/FimT family pseudopilin [Metapseudomonas resinovorans]|uniref:GspH/FimT family pseudopilin n=1 Tax=Metapseudomonas resinovorans TaxID=53412 RepID=UPI003B42F638
MTGNTRGFTLIELLVAVTLLAICIGLGTPSLTQFIRAQQLTATSQVLSSSLALARQESVFRKVAVLVDNQDGDWATGWWVYADQNGNGRWDESDVLIRQIGPQPAGVVIKGNSPVRRYIRYTPTGRATMLGGAFQAGTLTLCRSDGRSHVTKLVINAAGRVRRAKQPPGSC